MPVALRHLAVAAVVLTASALAGHVQAAPPWASLVPFKRIDADETKSYELEEAHGPWLIMATSFAGDDAEQQAQGLVLELRRQYKLKAYTFKQNFDFSQSEVGLGFNKYGGPKKMKPQNGVKFDEVAVLVGDFSSIEDPAVEQTLQLIKHAKPECLGAAPAKRYNKLREFYRSISKDPEMKSRGPMGAAFVSRNPLLPEEYFVAKGLDPFVVDMNKDLDYSLLKNPGKYTVRVASFRGVDTMKPQEFEQLTSAPRKLAKIDEAAIKAGKLTAALREQGIEAYEFHDRTESIVTIGAFDSVGEPRGDGKQEINPAVYRVMQAYGPIKEPIAGKAMSALQPRMLKGIVFDAQPLPVEVPRQSIATAYNRNSLLR